ncbi:TPA: phage BR0599 family protein [Pseudomonas putida]
MLTLQSIHKALSLSRPIELFLFEHGTEKYAYTSGSRQHLHTDGLVYTPLSLKRGKVQRTAEDYKNKLSIDMPGNSPVPLLFRSYLPSNHVVLRVFQTQRDLPGESINIFSGEVTSVTWNNSVASLDCNPISRALGRQVLRCGYQSQCNHHLYDTRCGLQIQDWQEDTRVTAIKDNGFTVEVASKANPDDYYITGLLSKNGSDFRMITSCSGNSFKLMSPIDGLKVGDAIQVAKGCDHSAAACQSFGNFDNFLGFLTIPSDNPFQVY